MLNKYRWDAVKARILGRCKSVNSWTLWQCPMENHQYHGPSPDTPDAVKASLNTCFWTMFLNTGQFKANLNHEIWSIQCCFDDWIYWLMAEPCYGATWWTISLNHDIRLFQSHWNSLIVSRFTRDHMMSPVRLEFKDNPPVWNKSTL